MLAEMSGKYINIEKVVYMSDTDDWRQVSVVVVFETTSRQKHRTIGVAIAIAIYLVDRVTDWVVC